MIFRRRESVLIILRLMANKRGVSMRDVGGDASPFQHREQSSAALRRCQIGRLLLSPVDEIIRKWRDDRRHSFIIGTSYQHADHEAQPGELSSHSRQAGARQHFTTPARHTSRARCMY